MLQRRCACNAENGETQLETVPRGGVAMEMKSQDTPLPSLPKNDTGVVRRPPPHPLLAPLATHRQRWGGSIIRVHQADRVRGSPNSERLVFFHLNRRSVCWPPRLLHSALCTARPLATVCHQHHAVLRAPHTDYWHGWSPVMLKGRSAIQ